MSGNLSVNPSSSGLSPARAALELSLAALLWGFGFVAAVWSLRAGDPLTITGWRFTIAGVIGIAVAYFAASRTPKHSTRRTAGLEDAAAGVTFWQTLLAARWAGLFICATLILQTWGLKFTTATKSGFLTCLYVLIVPIVEPLLGGPKPTRKIVLCAFAALAGVGLMCGIFNSAGLDEKSRLNIGDFLTLLCAFCASAHIFAVAGVGKKIGPGFNSFKFNNAQSLVAGLPALAVAIAVEPGAASFPYDLVVNPTIASLGFLSLAICSTLIAFALQIRAQKVISPATASLLFLLESPFAAIFAMIFLGETMGTLQLLGGALILISVGVGAYPTARSETAQAAM